MFELIINPIKSIFNLNIDEEREKELKNFTEYLANQTKIDGCLFSFLGENYADEKGYYTIDKHTIDAVVLGLKQNKKLTRLNINILAYFSDTGNYELEEIQLSKDYIPNKDKFDYFFYLLESQTALTYLNLKASKLGAYKQIGNFVKTLKNTKNLTYLNLSENDLKDEDIDKLKNLIAQNIFLEYIDFSGNYLGPDGIKKIFSALVNNKKSFCLQLNALDNLEDSIFPISYKGELSKTNILSLSLNNCSLHSITPLTEGWDKNISLKNLTLWHNELSYKSLIELINNSTLKEINFLTDVKKKLYEKVCKFEKLNEGEILTEIINEEKINEIFQNLENNKYLQTLRLGRCKSESNDLILPFKQKAPTLKELNFFIDNYQGRDIFLKLNNFIKIMTPIIKRIKISSPCSGTQYKIIYDITPKELYLSLPYLDSDMLRPEIILSITDLLNENPEIKTLKLECNDFSEKNDNFLKNSTKLISEMLEKIKYISTLILITLKDESFKQLVNTEWFHNKNFTFKILKVENDGPNKKYPQEYLKYPQEYLNKIIGKKDFGRFFRNSDCKLAFNLHEDNNSPVIKISPP